MPPRLVNYDEEPQNSRVLPEASEPSGAGTSLRNIRCGQEPGKHQVGATPTVTVACAYRQLVQPAQAIVPSREL